MIEFTTGKPGGGKSLYVLRKILSELIESDRPIITNLALKYSHIEDYCAKRGKNLNPEERIRILEDDEIPDFYRLKRVAGIDIELPLTTDLKTGYEICDFSFLMENYPDYCGNAYYLDEVDVYFPSRGWQKIPQGVTHYLKQHRKINDDLILNSQYLEQTWKDMRMLTEQYTYIANFANRKKGILTHTKKFRYSVFNNPSTGRDTPMFSGSFPLNLEEANCYDTSQGVGIRGKGAEKRKPPKGIPIRVFAVGCFLLLGCAVYGLPKLIQGGSQKFFSESATFNALTESTEAMQNPSINPVIQDNKKMSVYADSSNSLEISNVPKSSKLKMPLPELLQPTADYYYSSYMALGGYIRLRVGDQWLELPEDECYLDGKMMTYKGFTFLPRKKKHLTSFSNGSIQENETNIL